MNTKDIEVTIDIIEIKKIVDAYEFDRKNNNPPALSGFLVKGKPTTNHHEAEVQKKDDLLDDMWGLICNVNGGIVEGERPEWYEAFKRIRAKYLTPTKTDNYEI